jgi:hypothetical protein
MSRTKILVTGPTGSGKTTFVRTLSDGDVLETDEYTSESIGKPKTTVALDYTTTNAAGRTIHLYGTPGQERFSYMWRMLSAGADGMVLLYGANRPELDDEASNILKEILTEHDLPYVVGITHAERINGRADRIMERAQVLGPNALDTTFVDARDPESASGLLHHLLEEIPA